MVNPHDSRDDLSSGELLAKGAALGAVFGGLFGVFIAPVTELVSFGDHPIEPAMFVLAIYTAPVGLIYGLLAGLGAGASVVLLPPHARTPATARLLAATTGPAVVALLSWGLFGRPTFTVGANQTRQHVIESLMIAYVYPCGSALLVGAVGGSRLVAPVRRHDTPSWSAAPDH